MANLKFPLTIIKVLLSVLIKKKKKSVAFCRSVKLEGESNKKCGVVQHCVQYIPVYYYY